MSQTTRQILSLIRNDLGITARARMTGMAALDAVCRHAETGEYGQPLSCRLFSAAYGIAHALQTGRVYPQLALAIEALDCRMMTALVATVASACEVSGQVSAWLLANQDVIL